MLRDSLFKRKVIQHFVMKVAGTENPSEELSLQSLFILK